MTEILDAMKALSAPGPKGGAQAKGAAHGSARGVTSDLTIDETLLLHSIGWEPVDVVFGVAWWSIPWGVWQWQTGEITEASTAFAGAMSEAADELRAECAHAGGTGVVGVTVDIRVAAHHIDVSLSGTAVRRIGDTKVGFEFISDLSARDFVLLTQAGWWPLGLAAGASFVIAPRRSARQWAGQQGQNVELPNLTEALYLAREGAMSRMQEAGQAMKADGIVRVKMREGPLGRGSRVMQFASVGTAVHLRDGRHRSVNPAMVLSLDDPAPQFAAEKLRGA
ncbi:MAG: heavy metal-binding domain-containing protein [Actinomycetota bacterium]|jgi:uncharacterized protein YbjQ (UPF0145 family)|nr:heavy metal-binding domain-containing protein [Actinomycetota bacterium]